MNIIGLINLIEFPSFRSMDWYYYSLIKCDKYNFFKSLLYNIKYSGRCMDPYDEYQVFNIIEQKNLWEFSIQFIID